MALDRIIRASLEKRLRWLHSKSSNDKANLLLVIALWVAMVLLVNPVGNFPLNDDWVYGNSVKSILETGRFEIIGPSAVSLLPQAYWGALFAWPVGFSFTALRFSSLSLGLIGALALYTTLRAVGATRAVALLGATVLATNPVYLNLSNTFMTDVPFLCLTLLALKFMIRGLDDTAAWPLAAGIAWASLSVLIRPFGLITLAGFGLAYLIARGFKPTNFVIASLPFFAGVVLHLGVRRWLMTTGRSAELLDPGFQALIPTSIPDFISHSVRQVFYSIPYIGIFVLPFTLIARRAIKTTYDQAAPVSAVLSVMTIIIAMLLVWSRNTLPKFGNIMDYWGVGPLDLSGAPPSSITMQVGWLIATLLGAIGFVSLVDRTVRAVLLASLAPAQAMDVDQPWLPFILMWFIIAYWALLMIFVYWHHNEMFDRYLLPLLPFFIILLAWGARNNAGHLAVQPCWMYVAAIVVIAQGVFAVYSTHDYLAWNRSRWQALQFLTTEEKIPTSEIDGGYEGNGWLHNRTRAVYHRGDKYWSNPNATYLITAGPVTGYEEVARFPTDRWLRSTPSHIFILQRI
jgi:Dolichyl-phosphate-mannose-protein mannosyltransferase